jgi:lysyl-tRNA synthetase
MPEDEGESPPEDTEPEHRAEDAREHRLAKIQALRDAGIDPYPVRFDRDHTIGEIREQHAGLGPGEETDDRVKVAGRILLLRRQGGLSFAQLRDRSGEIQLFVDTKVVGPGVHEDFDHLDRGDWVGVEGTVMTTRRGELSVRVGAFELLGKALRPLPEKWKGLTDVDTRYRQRYVDLVVNDDARRVFEIRHKMIAAVRRYLTEQGFVEVEGPVLQSTQGGATARPFITHHNALDIDMYLRIALELHLKRLIVGGLERVFEIGRVFRNEGVDTHHNPEFTMLEAYQAFTDYHGMMDLTEGIITAAAEDVLGDKLVVQLDGQPLDLTPPWPRLSMAQLIKDKLGVEISASMPVEDARKILDGLEIPYQRDWGPGKLMNEIYDRKVQYDVRGPAFVIDHPREVSPLARVHRDDPTLTERFELIVGGHELCNAYSEQNDPVLQLEAFEAEAKAKAAGDAEAGDVDLDYVRALEYGMPCTGGLGIGMDRLAMLLAEVASIREVILFPTLRPEPGMGGPTIPGGRGPGAVGERAEPASVSQLTAAVAPAPPAPSRNAARLLAVLTAIGGIIALLTLVPAFHHRFQPFDNALGPLWFRVSSRIATVLLGVGLLFLAGQLAKQKHRAWQVAVVLFALATVGHVLKGPHPVAAAYSLLMVVLLVLGRRLFHAPSDPPSLLKLVRFAPLYLVVVFGYGAAALFTQRNKVDPDLTVWGVLTTTAKALVGVSGAYEYQSRFFAEFFPASMVALGIFGLIGLAWLLFRPLLGRRAHTSDDWEHASRLVHTYGWDTLAYFALRDDKSFFFSSDGEAMIAYAYLGGCGLASGDPIGRPESLPLVIDEFLQFCRDRAWKPAFLAVREADVPFYTSRGLRHFYLGDEAIIHCDAFSLDGAAMKDVRQAARRIAKQYRFRLIQESAASPELVDALNAISEKWRGKNPERGFTMALSQDVKGENPEFLLCVAFDERNEPGGFLRIVPAYGPDFGYTLDLMRHDPTAPNGLTEFLIAQTALALKDRGVVRLSMNFAAWGRLLAPDIHAGFTQRLTRRLVRTVSPFFQIQVQTLRDFNAKFEPEWLPRVIVYADPDDLPRVGILYAGAEGFLALPGVGPLLVPRAVGGVRSPDAA